MVNKIAIMALVGILAVPILLGYGLNLNEVTETDYAPEGEPVNVTQLLKNGTAYTTTRADPYTLNTNFEIYDTSAMPRYAVSGTSSSYPMRQFIFSPGDYYSSTLRFSDFKYFYQQFDENNSSTYITYSKVRISDNTVVSSYDRVYTWDWDLERGTVQFTTLDNTNQAVTHSYEWTVNTATDAFKFTPSGGYSGTGYAQFLPVDNPSTAPPVSNIAGYVDFSQGYYFDYLRKSVDFMLPERTESVLLTLNLDSITDSDYSIRIAPQYNGYLDLKLNKITDSGNVRWSVINLYNNEIVADNLYIDPSRTDNTYQLFIGLDQIQTNRYNYHTEFRYVGSWPTIIGAANYYMKYEYDQPITSTPGVAFTGLHMGEINNITITKTPIMRLDSALFGAFAYDIITDKTYTPADFKNNPTTTITDVQHYGTSIEFAGNTYNIDSSGNITLGVHKVSVNKLKLESVPVAVGYENRINGSVISVTAQPSTIKFNGQWGASISTVGNAATTTTKVEWSPGQFAWNGIDDNFLIVGMITCLGVFIALGMYARSHRASIWPVLLICGGAAVLFIFMI